MRIDSDVIPLITNQADRGAQLPVTGPQGLPAPAEGQPRTGAASGDFGDLLREALESVNADQHEADAAVRRLATGDADSLHEAIIALEKADLTLRLTASVTEKAIQAYRQVSQTQL